MEKKLEPTHKSTKEKLSYDELNNIAKNLSDQNNQLLYQLRNANMANMFKRLDYLFKVIENSDKFSTDFVIKCTDEIEDTMTIPEEVTDGREDTEQA